MFETIDDITIKYEENGEVVTKELEKEVLTRGAWTTIIFKYQDLDRKTNDFGPVKYSIRRYQKRNNTFNQKSKFNISNVKQAQQIIDVLTKWTNDDINNPSADQA